MKDASAIIKKLAPGPGVVRPSRWPAWFVLSSGAILALAGANSILAALGHFQVWDLPDPVLGIRSRYVLLVLALAELFGAFVCLFGKTGGLKSGFVLWLITVFVAYRIAAWEMGWHHPWIFVGTLADTWNISPLAPEAISAAILLYLFTGSAATLLFSPKMPREKEGGGDLKIHCPSCGGKTAYGGEWVGRSITCPHCGKPLTLR